MSNENLFNNKLIILIIFDTINIPLEQSTLLEIVHENGWVSMVDFNEAFFSLKSSGLIIASPRAKTKTERYAITEDGRNCLALWNTSLPLTLREEIIETINKNIIDYRKSQEFVSDYQKNTDGSYSVMLYIKGVSEDILELKINVKNREKAKWINENWKDRAPKIFEILQDELVK